MLFLTSPSYSLTNPVGEGRGGGGYYQTNKGEQSDKTYRDLACPPLLFSVPTLG